MYSRATKIIIVLRESTFSVIQERLHKGSVSESGLQILGSDEWVLSIWTYQKIVNRGSVRLVSERETDTSACFECLYLQRPMVQPFEFEGEATRAIVAEGLVFTLETVRRDDIARSWCPIRFAGQWVLQPWYITCGATKVKFLHYLWFSTRFRFNEFAP